MVGAVNADQATELLALDLFNTGARQIKLWDVEHCIHELRSHSHECRCGRCQAAAMVRPDRVLMLCAVGRSRHERPDCVRCADSVVDVIACDRRHCV
jgi:hypothetical protein